MLAKLILQISILLYSSSIICLSQILINQTELNRVTTKAIVGLNYANCGLSHSTQQTIGNKIVRGRKALEGEFPWQCLLKVNTNRGPIQCGASILNPRWILTAAHCVSDERNGQPTASSGSIEVTAGMTNRKVRNPRSQTRISNCVIQHERWSGQIGQFANDIALIRVSKDFDITHQSGGTVNTACLPTQPNSEYTGRARISGWGLTTDRGRPADELMYTDVSILENRACQRYEYPVPIIPTMICQGVDRTAPCQGDSGGPLITTLNARQPNRMTQIGVVSFGPGQCANPRTPNAIYTKISYYLSWIENTIKKYDKGNCPQRALRQTDQISQIKEQ